MGDTANGIVRGVELIGEDIRVGIDDAEQVIDGVRNGVNLGRGEVV